MKLNSRFLILTSVAAILSIMGSAASQETQQSELSRSPIELLNAEFVQTLEGGQKILAEGNVFLRQDESRLRCDRLTVDFPPAGAADSLGQDLSGAQRLECKGNVILLTPDQRARGDVGIYQAQGRTITLTGNVIVTDCRTVLRGGALVVYLDEDRTILRRGPNGDRVQGVLDENPPGEASGCDSLRPLPRR